MLNLGGCCLVTDDGVRLVAEACRDLLVLNLAACKARVAGRQAKSSSCIRTPPKRKSNPRTGGDGRGAAAPVHASESRDARASTLHRHHAGRPRGARARPAAA